MDLKIIPVVQVIIAVILMYLLSLTLPNLNYNFPTKNLLVLVLLAIAIFIGLSAVLSFKKHQTTVNPTRPENASKVVDSGIYAFSRNPMYLALLLLLIAVAFFISNLSAFFIIPLFIAYISKFQITPEEKALISLFGQHYIDYQQKVRRWL